jgi:hypothetical protein
MNLTLIIYKIILRLAHFKHVYRKDIMVSKQTRHNWIKRFSLKVKQSAKRYNRAKERSINRNPKWEN